MADKSDRPRNDGCLGAVLFIATLIIIDSFGTCLAVVGPTGYGPTMLTASLIGLSCGLVLGLCLSAKNKTKTALSRYYWWVGAVAGMIMPAAIVYFIASH